MPNRYTGNSDYKYGFNGQEQDNEVSGQGNSYTAEFWQYDSRLGRRWNIDPVVKHHESPYATFANNPIWLSDPNGADTNFYNKDGTQNYVMMPAYGAGTDYMVEDKNGSVSYGGKKWRHGLSYNSLFGDENKPKPTMYSGVSSQKDLFGLNDLHKNANDFKLSFLSGSDQMIGKIYFWKNSAQHGQYDYKNKNFSQENKDNVAILFNGILVNTHEAGMAYWGYTAALVYHGQTDMAAYKNLAMDNKGIHPILEGDGDEMGEVVMWTYGFFASKMGESYSSPALQLQVDKALTWYFGTENYYNIINPHGAGANDPKKKDMNKALRIITVNHNKKF